jgi:septation ring formation regulator EzrA
MVKFNKMVMEALKKEYYITCIVVDNEIQNIENVDVREVKEKKVSNPEPMEVRDIIKMIDDEIANFYSAFEKNDNEDATSISHWMKGKQIHKYGDFIRSNPDDITKNNVRNLSDCS